MNWVKNMCITNLSATLLSWLNIERWSRSKTRDTHKDNKKLKNRPLLGNGNLKMVLRKPKHVSVTTNRRAILEQSFEDQRTTTGKPQKRYVLSGLCQGYKQGQHRVYWSAEQLSAQSYLLKCGRMIWTVDMETQASWLNLQLFWIVFGRGPVRIPSGTPTALTRLIHDCPHTSRKIPALSHTLSSSTFTVIRSFEAL